MSTETNISVKSLVDTYVGVWNESDSERRRAMIRAIWSEDGRHVSPSADVCGYEQLDERVARTHQRWVATNGYAFGVREEPVRHHDVAKFRWEMTPDSGGEAESIGLDVIVLAEDGRARTIYQFIEL
jgi:hypothetical protein